MRWLVLCAVAVTALGLLPEKAAYASITSEYFVSDGNNGVIHVLQGTGVVRSFSTTSGEQWAIAVNGTIRTRGNRTSGAEYSLAGSFTGKTNGGVEPRSDIFDGTTDGTFNYAVEHATQSVLRFNADWSFSAEMFNLGTDDGRRLGITYDASNNSLWLGGWSGAVGNTIENRALDGTLLSSFAVEHNLNAALALDPADQTLWLFDRNTWDSVPTFEQYSKTGTLLNRIELPEIQGANMNGGEFSFGGTWPGPPLPPPPPPTVIPEPTTLVIWSLLAAICLMVYRRRRRTTWYPTYSRVARIRRTTGQHDGRSGKPKRYTVVVSENQPRDVSGLQILQRGGHRFKSD